MNGFHETYQTNLSLLVLKGAVQQQHAGVLDPSPHLGVRYVLVEHDAIQHLNQKRNKKKGTLPSHNKHNTTGGRIKKATPPIAAKKTQQQQH